MTAKQLFEYVLIETNKKEINSLLLEDFVYLVNKAIYQYLNICYNNYDINQQSSDNLRVLKSTAIISPTIFSENGVYELELPNDYFHLLNCVCQYKVMNKFKCHNINDVLYIPAKRLTSDLVPTINTNAYNRPSYKNSYYYIHNINSSVNNPTNSYDGTWGTDISNSSNSEVSGGLPNTIKLNLGTISNVDKISKVRYGNPSPIRMEIRCGKNSNISLDKVHIDYLKTPQYIRLTQEEFDSTADNSQILEFPDYACYEIINGLVKLLLENAGDPRLQTNIPINQTIATPAQQQSTK